MSQIMRPRSCGSAHGDPDTRGQAGDKSVGGPLYQEVASLGRPPELRAGSSRAEHRMDILRTPDARFVDLPDYPFAPNYVDVDSGDGSRLRIHYLDEGPPKARPCCCSTASRRGPISIAR